MGNRGGQAVGDDEAREGIIERGEGREVGPPPRDAEPAAADRGQRDAPS